MSHKKLGILGGTFDPIHVGHLILASLAADELGLSEVLFMPAQTPPHKQMREISPVGMRIEMIENAISPDNRFTLSRLDLTSDAPSYTYDLLTRLKTAMPGSDLVFLIGSDSLATFPTWHNPEGILELATLGVMRRADVDTDTMRLDGIPNLHERTTILNSPRIDISSTDIRQRIETGRTIRWLVPETVETYIDETGLYRS